MSSGQSSSGRQPVARFAPATPFARDLRRLGSRWIKSELPSTRANRWQWIRGMLIAGTGITAYLLILAGSLGGLVTILALTAIGLACFGMLMNFGHDASHGSLSRHQWVNDFFVFLSFGILGISGALWKDRHLRLHHTLPNVPGTEIDAYAAPLMRLSPLVKWRPIHRWQVLYGPVLLFLGTFHLVWIADFEILSRARKRSSPQSSTSITSFVASKLLHLLLFIVIPVIVLEPSFFTLILSYLWVTGLVSVIFSILVIGTHVSDLAEFPQPDLHGQLEQDWATLQVITTVDWSPDSHWAAWLTGGSNAHLAHHLFPGVSHAHSAKLSSLIHKLAAKHDLPTCVVPFHEMVRGWARQLYRLSKPS